MADQDRIEPSKYQITKHGQFDISPVTNLPYWTRVLGFLSIRGRIERLTGKRLSFSLYPRPITAIHYNQLTGIFIQTDQALFFYDKETVLTGDVVTSDVDGSIVTDDTNDDNVLAY